MMKVAVMTVMVKVKIVMTRTMIPTKSDWCIICNNAIQLPLINLIAIKMLIVEYAK